MHNALLVSCKSPFNFACKWCLTVNRQSLVSGLHTGHREELKSIFSECSKNPVESIRLIQALIKEMGEKFCDDYVSQADEKVLTMEIARELMQLSESIYYKILEDIILDERRRLPGTDLSGTESNSFQKNVSNYITLLIFQEFYRKICFISY